jgi:hypothetical protein
MCGYVCPRFLASVCACLSLSLSVRRERLWYRLDDTAVTCVGARLVLPRPGRTGKLPTASTPVPVPVPEPVPEPGAEDDEDEPSYRITCVQAHPRAMPLNGHTQAPCRRGTLTHAHTHTHTDTDRVGVAHAYRCMVMVELMSLSLSFSLSLCVLLSPLQVD